MEPTAVFSAQAEVFPKYIKDLSPTKRFLRASGGVSEYDQQQADDCEFSPRKRRCFYETEEQIISDIVFSAQAEVFLESTQRERRFQRFLRASGGVSLSSKLTHTVGMFSPRKRRCFLQDSLYWCD